MGVDQPRVRVVILDFDGVVIESNAAKTEAFAEVFARFPEHAEAMMDYHHENVAASRFVKFDHLVSTWLGRPGDTALVAELAAQFSRLSQKAITAAPLVPGAERFLAEFSECVPLYLASVTPADDLSETLRRRALREFFKGVYGCPPWTKPAAVRDILTLERCSPTEAVLVGDSNGDRRAAEETGVEFVARDSGLSFDPPVPIAFRDLDAVADFLRPRVN